MRVSMAENIAEERTKSHVLNRNKIDHNQGRLFALWSLKQISGSC